MQCLWNNDHLNSREPATDFLLIIDNVVLTHSILSDYMRKLISGCITGFGGIVTEHTVYAEHFELVEHIGDMLNLYQVRDCFRHLHTGTYDTIAETKTNQ